MLALQSPRWTGWNNRPIARWGGGAVFWWQQGEPVYLWYHYDVWHTIRIHSRLWYKGHTDWQYDKGQNFWLRKLKRSDTRHIKLNTLDTLKHTYKSIFRIFKGEINPENVNIHLIYTEFLGSEWVIEVTGMSSLHFRLKEWFQSARQPLKNLVSALPLPFQEARCWWHFCHLIAKWVILKCLHTT